MKSLRGQLGLGVAIGTIAVLLAFGFVLNTLIEKSLRADFDASLAAKARSLAGLAETGDDGFEFELTEFSLSEFEPSDHSELYQLWLADGSSFARSPSLAGGDLPRAAIHPDGPFFQTIAFADGRPGRTVQLTFLPRQEDHDRSEIPPRPVTLVLGRDLLGLNALLVQTRALLVAGCIGACLLSVAILYALVRRSLRPIDHLSRQISTLEAGDLSTRFAPAGIPTELLPVIERLNGLLARLEAAFQRERRFTGDVAHELRTPLAGLRAKTEVALSKDRNPDEYRQVLNDCAAISLQMHRMVELLLRIARADAGRLELKIETTDINILVRSCWTPLAATAAARHLSVDWKLNSPASLRTDPDQLRLVITNVLDNAVTYANDGGRIVISTAPKTGSLLLTISNTGSRLPPESVRHVFDRFWRADPARDAHGGHWGLGLPLSKALVESLGGSIAASTDHADVFTLSISLPIAE